MAADHCVQRFLFEFLVTSWIEVQDSFFTSALLWFPIAPEGHTASGSSMSTSSCSISHFMLHRCMVALKRSWMIITCGFINICLSTKEKKDNIWSDNKDNSILYVSIPHCVAFKDHQGLNRWMQDLQSVLETNFNSYKKNPWKQA